MIRSTFSLCAVLGLMSTAACAQTAAPAPKHSAKATVAKSTPRPIPSTPRQKLASEAKSLALATDTVEAITENRLEIATRVLTGFR